MMCFRRVRACVCVCVFICMECVFIINFHRFLLLFVSWQFGRNFKSFSGWRFFILSRYIAFSLSLFHSLCILLSMVINVKILQLTSSLLFRSDFLSVFARFVSLLRLPSWRCLYLSEQKWNHLAKNFPSAITFADSRKLMAIILNVSLTSWMGFSMCSLSACMKISTRNLLSNMKRYFSSGWFSRPFQRVVRRWDFFFQPFHIKHFNLMVFVNLLNVKTVIRCVSTVRCRMELGEAVRYAKCLKRMP